ncbi:hypothetical protein EDB84DRAFT_1446569, partial [Lactarius hengduanensis]
MALKLLVAPVLERMKLSDWQDQSIELNLVILQLEMEGDLVMVTCDGTEMSTSDTRPTFTDVLTYEYSFQMSTLKISLLLELATDIIVVVNPLLMGRPAGAYVVVMAWLMPSTTTTGRCPSIRLDHNNWQPNVQGVQGDQEGTSTTTIGATMTIPPHDDGRQQQHRAKMSGRGKYTREEAADPAVRRMGRQGQKAVLVRPFPRERGDMDMGEGGGGATGEGEAAAACAPSALAGRLSHRGRGSGVDGERGVAVCPRAPPFHANGAPVNGGKGRGGGRGVSCALLRPLLEANGAGRRERREGNSEWHPERGRDAGT